MATLKKIVPHLWFQSDPQEAVKFYTSIFKNSKIGRIAYYSNEGFDHHKHHEGEVLTIEFELDGNKFLALNGGPDFKFNEAISFMIFCKDQKEINYYWDKLTTGGEEQQCGWLKDKFGISWQVVPEKMIDWTTDTDPKKVKSFMHAMFQMKKLDMDVLERAHDGEMVEV
jgi:predicted 3-demethylubiquinone-9 3-methyltransferase (glyoxalase superfamily)